MLLRALFEYIRVSVILGCLVAIVPFFMVGIYNSLFFVIIFFPINILFFKYTKIRKRRAILFFYDHLEFRFRPF